MKKLTIILLIAAMTVVACPAEAAGTAFTDVPDTHWAHDAICRAVELGITSGYPDGTFGIRDTTTCSHFSVFLARAIFKGEYDDSVSPWYEGSVKHLKSFCVFHGTAMEQSQEALGRPVTRYDMAQMMVNALFAKGIELEADEFAAVERITDWDSVPVSYRPAVAACYGAGILNGLTDGSFGGDKTVTRAQGCVAIIRLKDYFENSPKPAIQVGSVKGNCLKENDRSGLIIAPFDTEYDVTSGDPNVVDLEMVSGRWVLVTNSPGTAVITVMSNSGDARKLLITVEEEKEAPVVRENSARDAENNPVPVVLDANMEIREVMIRRINDIRVENGVPVLPVSDVLMDAAQDISTQKKTQHGPHEWETMMKYGWTHGGGVNLTSFSINDFTNIGETAVRYWTYSAGHFQTMIRDDVTCLGVGVTVEDYVAYCYLIVRRPRSSQLKLYGYEKREFPNGDSLNYSKGEKLDEKMDNQAGRSHACLCLRHGLFPR